MLFRSYKFTLINCPVSSCKFVADIYKSIFKKHWLNIVNKSDSKLRIYAQFKNCLQYENYLNDIHIGSHRRALTKLRTSSHSLHIETGRYTRPKTPVEGRKCTCREVVEDELHFLTEFNLYDKEREMLFRKVASLCPQFVNLDFKDKFTFLVTAEKEIACATGEFCYLAFEKRKTSQASQMVVSNCK